MERVAFLIEETGERLGCLLNPESLVMRRSAGLRARRSAGGLVTGAGLTDDPLIGTGGGTTELVLDLLFDVHLAEGPRPVEDVRDLTRPLWELAENQNTDGGYGRPPLVRFIWGKAWNVLGVVATLAERLERFTPGGAPERSWLRMLLRRVTEPPPRPVEPLQPEELLALSLLAPAPDELADDTPVHEMLTVGAAAEPAAPEKGESEDEKAREAAPAKPLGERLDQIAFRYYGDASLWRVLAAFNGIDRPLGFSVEVSLKIPPLSTLWKALGGE